jgi:hypothetical protein
MMLELKRLVWAGPLTVLASCLAVLLIRTAAVAILKPDPTFLPLSVKPEIIDTVGGAGAAVLVFHAMCRDTYGAVNKYRSLALKALAVSFLPDVGSGLAAIGLKPPRWRPCMSPLARS